MTTTPLLRAWNLRPRWVLTRPLRRVKAMNADRIVVRGVPRFAPAESLYSVGFFGELRPRFWQTVWYLMAPGHRLVPRAAVLGDMTEDEFESSGHELTRVSRLVAVHAAARWLGLAPELDGRGAVVTALEVDGPCDGLLRPGDVIVAAAGAPVRVAADLSRALKACTAPTLRLDVAHAQSDAGPGHLTRVELPVTGEHGTRRRLGLKVATHRVVIEPGPDVEVLEDPESSGPSAGLVSALAVIDVLTPGTVTGGLKVAATGTVDPYGVVGEVAGVGMKACAAHRAGMDLLLVPRGQRAEAIRGLPRGATLRVVEVATLGAAIDKLVALGGTRPQLPRPEKNGPEVVRSALARSA